MAYDAESSGRAVTYTARELDTESGLYLYRARYYDPQTGRFLNEDPIGLAGGDQNLYAYVFDDPINNTDPSGLFKKQAGKAVADFFKGFKDGFSGGSPNDFPTDQSPAEMLGEKAGEEAREFVEEKVQDAIENAIDDFLEPPSPDLTEPGCRGGICNKDVPENRQPAPPDDPAAPC